jgi:hypothetical protein
MSGLIWGFSFDFFVIKHFIHRHINLIMTLSIDYLKATKTVAKNGHSAQGESAFYANRRLNR